MVTRQAAHPVKAFGIEFREAKPARAAACPVRRRFAILSV